jgi:hypothetical protein
MSHTHFDVAKQREIQSLSRLEIPGGGQVRIQGRFAFVGHLAPPYGTTIVDVSDPRAPKIVSQIVLESELFHTHKVRLMGDLMVCNVEMHDRHFRRKGAEIAALDERCRREHGRPAVDEEIAADLAEPTAARPLFDAAQTALGQISILVHSASPKRSEDQTILAVTEAEWDAMLTVGLRAGFVLGQSVGAHMKACGIKGRMLYITSLHAHSPRNLPHYSATKAGQIMLVKELARALGGNGIRVNAIAPARPDAGHQI